MRAVGNFSPINPGESEVFGFDFTNDLPPTDTIEGTPVATLSVISGLDQNAASRIDGAAEVTGNIVLQRITGPLSGVVYGFQIAVETRLGNTLILWAPLPCQPVGA